MAVRYFQNAIRHCKRRTMRRAPSCFRSGRRPGRLFVLAAGTVEVLRGDTRVALISDAGAVFGEMSILLNTPHTATVRTVTDL